MAKKTFKIKGNLAEALGDTVSSAKNNAGELHIEAIPLRKIQLDPDNPRDLILTFDDIYQDISKADGMYERKCNEKESLGSLAKSIKEQGIINPILVYKHNDKYRLIAGERRTLASILAEKEDIPAKILTTRPKSLEMSLLQWIENIEREDLTLWERFRNLEKILLSYAEKQSVSTKDVSPAEISRLLGCSLQQAVNYRHILNSTDELKKHIESGKVKNIEKAAYISSSPLELQDMLIQSCINGFTLSELKRQARGISLDSKAKDKSENPMKINFGTTDNTFAAKTIIDTVLEHKNFQHFSDKFRGVCWDDHKSIATAFRQLVKLLEQHNRG
tara:strand:- start:428 stop:1423 length:996 start_codon:yes stop_codon:yes gene_type:complete